MIDRHARVKELFNEIKSTWPHTHELDLPEIGDPLAGVTFHEDIPPVDPVQLTDHAKRVLNALDRRKAGRMASKHNAEKMLF
jgi:hypothetical protein